MAERYRPRIHKDAICADIGCIFPKSLVLHCFYLYIFASLRSSYRAISSSNITSAYRGRLPCHSSLLAGPLYFQFPQISLGQSSHLLALVTSCLTSCASDASVTAWQGAGVHFGACNALGAPWSGRDVAVCFVMVLTPQHMYPALVLPENVKAFATMRLLSIA